MGGLSPLAKLQSLGYNQLDDNFLLFPVLLLDELKPTITGNDLLTMDKKLTCFKTQVKYNTCLFLAIQSQSLSNVYPGLVGGRWRESQEV